MEAAFPRAHQSEKYANEKRPTSPEEEGVGNRD